MVCPAGFLVHLEQTQQFASQLPYTGISPSRAYAYTSVCFLYQQLTPLPASLCSLFCDVTPQQSYEFIISISSPCPRSKGYNWKLVRLTYQVSSELPVSHTPVGRWTPAWTILPALWGSQGWVPAGKGERVLSIWGKACCQYILSAWF